MLQQKQKYNVEESGCPAILYIRIRDTISMFYSYFFRFSLIFSNFNKLVFSFFEPSKEVRAILLSSRRFTKCNSQARIFRRRIRQN